MTEITHEEAGTLQDGRPITLWRLANDDLEVELLDLGVRLKSLTVKGAPGGPRNVVLGYQDPANYEHDRFSMGAVLGRYANRIAQGTFRLNGRDWQLVRNEGAHHLHGGREGFAGKVWRSSVVENGVRFRYRSPAGEAGYPGELEVRVEVTLVDGTLTYRYNAVARADTIVNLTNHVYFNLAGGGTILDHELSLDAPAYLPVDAANIPTGEIRATRETPFDFWPVRRLGRDIDAVHPDLEAAGGYDHCFVVSGGGYRRAARLRADGIQLTVATTEPGVQLYTGNRLDTTHAGVCLETQHFPDSPNRPRFPSVLIRPGDQYASVTSYSLEAA